MLSLLTLPLACKRDVLLARQRARQIAQLFHFEPAEQACIAAGAFAVAAQALRHSRAKHSGAKHSRAKHSGAKHSRAMQLCVQIDNKTLHIFARPCTSEATLPDSSLNDSPLRLAKPLPGAADLSGEDLSWLFQQLNEQGCFNWFEEIQHQNQEMLALLHSLHALQVQMRHLQESQSSPRAA